MTNKQKPDGYVVVEQMTGPLLYTICKTKKGCEHEYYEKGGEGGTTTMMQIRPFKLVFLDEVEDD